MQNLTDYLYHVCAIFIFCMALALLLFMNRELSKLVLTTKKLNKNVYNMYEQHKENTAGSAISYAELISTLCCKLEYDIQINEIIIKADTYYYLNYDFSKIPINSYSKSYILDSEGNIIRIVYRSN